MDNGSKKTKSILISKAILTLDQRSITRHFPSVSSLVTNPRVAEAMGVVFSTMWKGASCTCEAPGKSKRDMLSSFVPKC